MVKQAEIVGQSERGAARAQAHYCGPERPFCFRPNVGLINFGQILDSVFLLFGQFSSANLTFGSLTFGISFQNHEKHLWRVSISIISHQTFEKHLLVFRTRMLLMCTSEGKILINDTIFPNKLNSIKFYVNFRKSNLQAPRCHPQGIVP